MQQIADLIFEKSTSKVEATDTKTKKYNQMSKFKELCNFYDKYEHFY